MIKYKEWMDKEGIQYQERKDGVLFKSEDTKFLITLDKKDNCYFRVITVLPYDKPLDNGAERLRAYEILNTVNRDFQIVKACINKGFIQLAMELRLEEYSDARDVMPKTISTLNSVKEVLSEKLAA